MRKGPFTRNVCVCVFVWFFLFCSWKCKQDLFTPSGNGSESEKVQSTSKNDKTRMHSSRMCTAHSSSRGGSPPGTPPGADPPWSRHPPGSRHPRTRHPLGAGTPWTRHPPVDRHTPVNILPCPKLRLRAVNINDKHHRKRLVRFKRTLNTIPCCPPFMAFDVKVNEDFMCEQGLSESEYLNDIIVERSWSQYPWDISVADPRFLKHVGCLI